MALSYKQRGGVLLAVFLLVMFGWVWLTEDVAPLSYEVVNTITYDEQLPVYCILIKNTDYDYGKVTVHLTYYTPTKDYAESFVLPLAQGEVGQACFVAPVKDNWGFFGHEIDPEFRTVREGDRSKNPTIKRVEYLFQRFFR
jgi:hypothetical protein